MTIKYAEPKRPKAEGYGARLGTDWFRLAAGPDHPVAITTRDSLAERLDQKASAFENVLDVGYSFSRNNLTGGEGLDWYPRISQTGQVRDLDAIRFWDSANVSIDPPDRGQKYTAELNRQIQVFWSPPNTPVDLNESQEFIYIAHGDTLTWFSGWDDNTVVPGQEFVFPTDLVKVETTASNEVIVLTDDGHLWFKPFDEPTTFVEVYDLTEITPDDIPLTNIWAVKGRILAERTAEPGTGLDGTIELVEGAVANIGTPGVPIWHLAFTTLDSGGARFRSCIDAGTAILAAVGDGSIRSYVPQSDTSGGTPELTPRGTYPTPSGEEPFTIGFTAGKTVFLTIADEEGLGTKTCRAYVGVVQGEQLDFVLGDTQQFRIWRGTTETISITKRMLSDRDRIIWSMEEAGFVDNTWQYNVITTGAMRNSTIGVDVSSGVLFNELFGARGTVTDDIYYTDPTLFQPSGYIIAPNVNFGLNTPINWIAVVLEGENIQGSGDQLELWGAVDPKAIEDPDSPAWFLMASISNPAQSGLEVPIINLQSKSLALQVKFYATKGGTESPILTRFSVRGFPAHRDFIVDVPVNVSDTVSAPGRMPYRIPGLGNFLHTRLLDYSGRSIRLTVLDPPLMVDGVVDQIAEPTNYISDRGSVTRYCQVRIRGTITDGTSVGANQGLGVGKLGVSTLGIDKVTEEL